MRKFAQDEYKSDIFVKYGYGVVAFFKLLRTLIITFSILSFAVALP